MKNTLTVVAALFGLISLCEPTAAQTMTAYGIEIGAPIAVAECQKETIVRTVFYAASPRVRCMWTSPVTAAPADFARGGFMAFPLDQAPRHSWSNTVGISATDGIVGVVVVNTPGLLVQDSVFSDLVVKYGKPTSRGTMPFQNGMGAKFDGIVASWDLEPFQVEFLGMTAATDKGLLLIGTKAAMKERQARIDAARSALSKPL